MLDKTKTDKELGLAIENYLIENKINTPLIQNNTLTEQEKIDLISNHFKEIMNILNLDLNDDSLKDTPRRIAKMYVNEIFWGLKPENFPKCTTIENKFNYDELVIIKDIKVNSTCEHHNVVIYGKAFVAYKSKNKIIGLSKINRIVEYFCKRPQVQERLTEQIWFALSYILETEDIAIIIDAEHFCVKTRGVEDINSKTVTSKLGGMFLKSEARLEFLSLIKN